MTGRKNARSVLAQSPEGVKHMDVLNIKKRPPEGGLEKQSKEGIALHGRNRAHVRDWRGVGVVKGNDFPCIRLLDQSAQQAIVQRMPRFETLELANQAVTQQV